MGLTLVPPVDAVGQVSANNGATSPSQHRIDMEFNVLPPPALALIAQSMTDLESDRQAAAADIPHRSIAVLNSLLAQTADLRELYRKANLQASGASCYELHLLFDKHHNEQERIATLLSERVQALGGVAFVLVRNMDEEALQTGVPSVIETPLDKLQRLAEAHERLLVEAQPLGREAESPNDLGTHDMILREVVRTNARQIWFVTRLLSPPSDDGAATSLY
ncbi:ferritin-like domain-containing protein [Scleromatobacter humisilvae]|uniref:DNA starvation/stationary phase protection protein n=1 Tax=Scleromatobacter humisilvae TaxID=2897159 RepID=A0A9X2C463_9BURK|nr:ferritin-like domain-containing protein [Scleromatobacter humisilvae]MCK9689434.1 DNA starvation/stationary phase protection protein [Scleromatobacter humisilvae]